VQGITHPVRGQVQRQNVHGRWITYPILDITETPDKETVLIDHPEIAPSGAGEPSIRRSQPPSLTRSFDHRRAHAPGAVLADASSRPWPDRWRPPTK